ncbi:MBL fold metallo-hydrolase [Elongatibacter sediminis]|uniref:MBL fold metallo-hydrolase n=1 Tax=Elongatibacter sediminis TaxID=3119006 RepID=A0AAW9R8R4_9GAMM
MTWRICAGLLFVLSGTVFAEVSDGPYATGMHVVMTGTGSAMPDPERAGASVAVTIDGTILQFDFGRGVMEGQIQAGINPLDVDYGFLTHHHFDHVASYDYFLYATWIAGRQSVMGIYGPSGTEALHEGALRGMHASDYRFVQFIVDKWPPDQKVKPMYEPPFDVHDSGAGTVLETDSFKVTAISSPHYPYDAESLAYRVDSRHGSVVISGDTGPSEQMVELARGADILIHELTKPDPGMLSGGKFASKEFQKPDKDRPQTGHTAPSELGDMATRAGVKMLVGYHVNPLTGSKAMLDMMALYTGGNPGEQVWSEVIHAVKTAYEGPFVLADDGMVFTVNSGED